MFKKLFQNFAGTSSDDVREIYNRGVNALARGQLDDAISLFEQVCEEHPSAAYNLGLIYLDGAGQITPKYNLARKYLQMADRLGHERARTSAQFIGLNEERKFSQQEQLEAFIIGVSQYIAGRQLGNLAYMIAYDIKRNILETSSNEQYSLDRFLSYEVWCIRNYGDDDVMALYETSSLKYFPNNYYEEDWENGETAIISDYLNEKVFATIMQLGAGELQFNKLGTLRLAAVNAVYEYYL